MRENISTSQEMLHLANGETMSSYFFSETASTRNLRLIWLNGRGSFLNYAYLVGGEIRLGEEYNEILLNFSGQIVSLKGYALQMLYNDLAEHLPTVIFETDPRYIDVVPFWFTLLAG